MISILHGLWLWMVLILVLQAGGEQDGQNTGEDIMHRGDSKVILGAILGDVETLRLGVSEGGEPNAVLSELIGYVLQLGRPHIDFPIMPAAHLCMHAGRREHSNAVFDLIQKGADPNLYRVQEHPGDYGFAPAILYSLGLGAAPTTSHAALLQRAFSAVPEKFNFTSVQQWILATGNPPLSHVPALLGFTEGLYVLIADLGWNIHEQDTHGLTPLHVAAWRGDAMMVALLLTKEANRVLPDKHGRLPLHYAAMRGYTDVIELLFIPPPASSKTKPAQWAKMRRTMLTHKDNDKRTALMLAALVPSVPTSVRGIRTQMTQDKLLPEGRWNRAPLHGERTILAASEYDEPPGLMGGWASLTEAQQLTLTLTLTEAQQRAAAADERTDIDVIRCTSLSRGVFRRDYFSTQRPLLVSGQPLAGHPIWAYWQHDAFLERYGAAQMHTGEALYAERGKPDWNYPPPRTLSLRDWVQEQMSSFPGGLLGTEGALAGAGADASAAGDGAAQVCILGSEIGADGTCTSPAPPSATASTSLRPWLAHTASSGPTSAETTARLLFDVDKPKAMRLCGDRDKEHIRIIAGPRGAGEPLQASNASWTVVLAGRVRWMLIPPGVNASESLRLGGERSEEFPAEYRVLSAAAWVDEVAPSIRARGLLFEVTQYPGEVLFVPAGWHTLSLLRADSIMLQQQFCTMLNTDQRVQPLGLAIYGGNDTFRGFGRTKYEYRLKPEPLEKRSRIPSF